MEVMLGTGLQFQSDGGMVRVQSILRFEERLGIPQLFHVGFVHEPRKLS